jgi:hypothetical protein
VSDTIQQQDPATVPAPAKGCNGFAVTSLITGILGFLVITIPLGLVFGILGLFRAKKVHRGGVMSVIGIVLSVVFLAGFVVVLPHLVKLSNPACSVALKVQADYPDSKLAADAQKDPKLYAADLQAMIAKLTDATSKSTRAEATTQLKAEVADLTAMLGAVASGQAPTADMQAQAKTDESALTKACGGF